MVKVATEIIDRRWGKQFYVLITNLGVKRIHLPKNMLVGMASDEPPLLMHMYMEEPATVADTVNVVYYKPIVEKYEQMKFDSKVTGEDMERDQKIG